jgi:hypothetical protein
MIIDGEMDAMSAENALFSEITTQMQVNRNSLKSLLIFISLFIFISYCAAEEVRIEGNAVEQFQRIGAWGWVVSVGRVQNGPDEMEGGNVSVYLTSANPEEYPPGFIDPNIVAGDRVAVYGLLETAVPDAYDILLVGSKQYYLKQVTS